MERLRSMLSSKKVVPRSQAERATTGAQDRTRPPSQAGVADPPRKRMKKTAQRPVSGPTSQQEEPDRTAEARVDASTSQSIPEDHDGNRASGSTLPLAAVYSGIVDTALRGSVADAIRQPRPDNIIDILADLHGSMCQNIAAGSAVMVDLACQWKVDPELLQKALEKRKVSSAALEESRLRGEISRLHEELVLVRAEVSERDIAFEILKEERNQLVKEAKFDRDRYNARVASLVSKLEFAEQKYQKEKAEREKYESESQDKGKEIEEMTEVMGQEIERLKLLGLRQGMTDVMKKVKAKYPDADLRYFADPANVPEEYIDPALFGNLFDGIDSPSCDASAEKDARSDGEEETTCSEQPRDDTTERAGGHSADERTDAAPTGGADDMSDRVVGGEILDIIN